MDTSQSIFAFFDNFHPLALILVAGLLGSLVVIVYDAYNGYFSWRSLAHVLFGLVGAFIAGLIDTVPNNTGLFLTALIAGIGGISIMRQYLGRTEDSERQLAAIEEKATAGDKLAQYADVMDKIKRIVANSASRQQAVDAIEAISEVIKRVEA
jgi:hypothetical protein